MPVDQNFIWENVTVNHNGCWLWGKYINPRNLYAQHGRRYVHRLAYELFKGDVPEGHDLDHRKDCPKHCVNPDHLRPVTRAMNTRLIWRRRLGQMPRAELRVARWIHKQVTKRLDAHL